MIRRNLFALALVGTVFWSSIHLCRSTNAQAGFQAPSAPETSVPQVLDEGRRLEQDDRWGEALTHYEDAARRYPSDAQLQRRVKLARFHFDLSRRYSDSSYLRVLKHLTEQQALDLFGEVALKIQSHYVQSPDWNQLLRQGTQGLQIALSDEDFALSNRIRVEPERVDLLIQRVRQVLDERRLADRTQTQEMVRWIARTAAARLGLSTSAVVLEYMCSATNSLDAYSTFLTADQLDDVYSQIEGNFVGLGIELKADDRSLLIADVISDGPADRAGIRAGDRIIAVDGTSTQDVSTDQAADLLKGEEGSVVQVMVVSPDATQRQLNVRREQVEVPSVEDVRIVDSDSGVGYFQINSFQKTTSRDVDAALWKLHRQGMRSLIVDVRGNPGGLLTEAVEVADRFVVEGTIVTTHGRNVRENYDYKAHRVGTWRVPLVILIDGDSASASEIFAGAIRDHRRGTVVGFRSYGKGSVQGIFPLRVVKGGVRLTTAKFYSPSGQAISDSGVEPNLKVRSAARPVTLAPRELSDEDDVVLKAGIRVARDLIAVRQGRTQAGHQSAGRNSHAAQSQLSRGKTLVW